MPDKGESFSKRSRKISMLEMSAKLRKMFKFASKKEDMEENVFSWCEVKPDELEGTMLEAFARSEEQALYERMERVGEEVKQLGHYVRCLIEHCETFEENLTELEDKNRQLEEKVARMEEEKKMNDREQLMKGFLAHPLTNLTWDRS